jgi:hypothetical protein
MIDEKANIRHTVRDHSFHSHALLLVGLTVSTRQFRGYDLRVIQCCDSIPVTA